MRSNTQGKIKKSDSLRKSYRKKMKTGGIIMLLSPLAAPIGFFLAGVISSISPPRGLSFPELTAAMFAVLIALIVGLMILINGIYSYQDSRRQ
jgi:Ni/Fe-hydrogenase subunit HybB-like protein